MKMPSQLGVIIWLTDNYQFHITDLLDSVDFSRVGPNPELGTLYKEFELPGLQPSLKYHDICHNYFIAYLVTILGQASSDPDILSTWRRNFYTFLGQWNSYLCNKIWIMLQMFGILM